MSVSFLLDENIPYALIDLLEIKGFSVDHLKKINKVGIRNGEVYQLAEEKKMWIPNLPFIYVILLPILIR